MHCQFVFILIRTAVSSTSSFAFQLYSGWQIVDKQQEEGVPGRYGSFVEVFDYMPMLFVYSDRGTTMASTSYTSQARTHFR